jgi:hypothetical protein
MTWLFFPCAVRELIASSQALSTKESHPAQRDAFIDAYRFLLSSVAPGNIIFMGDSAGGEASPRILCKMAFADRASQAGCVFLPAWS